VSTHYRAARASDYYFTFALWRATRAASYYYFTLALWRSGAAHLFGA